MMKFTNSELQDRYLHDEIFRRRVEKSEQQYAEYLKKAGEKHLGICDEILERFMKEGNEALYFFYGYLQPTPGSKTPELTLWFMKNFQPDPNQRFTIVYFNNQTPSSDYYFEFKKILALLPLRIMERLVRFILVKPYFYIKAFDYLGLGTLNRIFNNRYITVENCTQLLQNIKVDVKDFVTFVPEEISEEFPKLLKRRPSLVSYRVNLQGQNMTEDQKKEKKVFQMAINALITKEVYKLQNYELGDIGVPIIIQLLIHYFRTKPEGLDQEGIFRKSVSIDQQNETLEELSKRNYEYLQYIQNPFLIASLIKKFFHNLKEPIIPFKTYQKLIHDQGVKDKEAYVKAQIKELPNLNYITLAFLIQFLKKDVLLHENKSKMSANNLAICFSPSLMRAEKPSMADLINASKSVFITNILLSNFQDIFGNQEQRELLYKKNALIRDIDFKQNIKKELNIIRESEDQTFDYSISITEPHTKEMKQEMKIGKQAFKEEEKPEMRESRNSNRGSRNSRMRVPIFSKKEETLKSEPPDSKQVLSEIETTFIRTRSAGRNFEVVPSSPVPLPALVSEAVRSTLKLDCPSKQIEEKK